MTDRPGEKMQDVSCPAPTPPCAPTQRDPPYCLGWWVSTRGEFNSSSPGVFSTLKDIFRCHNWEVENRSHLTDRGVPGGSVVKNQPAMQETRQKPQVRSLGGEETLEKEMVTHSSILAWEIPWTEEPGGL